MKLHQKLFWLLVFLLPTQLGKHFWPEWSYVLGLRIDYLSPTIYLTDLLVMGILGLWFWENIGNWKLAFQRNLAKRYWWVAAIFLYLFATSLLAQNPGAALYKFFKILEFSLLAFYVFQNDYTPYAIRHTLSLAVICSSLIAIAQFIKQSSLNGVFWWLGERTFTSATLGIAKAVVDGRLLMRPYATFPHPNALAGFVLVSLVLIRVSQDTSDGRPRGLLRDGGIRQWMTMILGLSTIAISFSHSAWLVGLLIGGWFLLKHLKGGMLAVIPTALLLIKLPFSTEEAVFQRVQLIKAGTLINRSAPLTGVGLNNFIVRLPEFWSGSETIRFLQPVHNIFLLVAAETGLVGLAIFLWFLLLTYKRLLITNYQLLITALSAILALGLFDHYWLTLQQTQLLFAIVVGLSRKKG